MTEMVKCKLNGRWDIILPKHRADRPEWYTETGWEKKRLEHMHSKIKKGDLIYYVGSEEGDMAALCAMWGGKMMLFEPNPKVWSNTKAIWEANNLPTPMTYCGFASDKVKIVDPDHLYERGFPDYADQEIIAAHGFKELNKEANSYNQTMIDNGPLIEDIKFIILDVEGAEGMVLRGAEQTMRKYKPKIYLSLHPEFLKNEYNEEGATLRKWLMDLGYKETLIDYPLHEVHLYYE